MPPLTAAAKLKPSFSGTWRLLGEAAGLVVDLPDEVVGQLPVPGCLLADAGEGVVQVGVLWTLGRLPTQLERQRAVGWVEVVRFPNLLGSTFDI